MLFPIKTETEMLNEMMEELRVNTNITNMTPGSIARTLLEIFNKKMVSCYRYLDLYTSMTFLSTSAGQYLDLLGGMLSCTRLANESDENYRYRISQQVFTAASSNYTSVRLQCLALDGVKDILITPYTYGNGSFTIHVLTDEISPSPSLLRTVDSVVQRVKAVGIKAVVKAPTLVPIDVIFNVTVRQGYGTNKEILRDTIYDKVSDYIDSIQLGGSISIPEILRVAQSENSILKIYIEGIYVDGNAITTNDVYKLNWDERGYMNKININM